MPRVADFVAVRDSKFRLSRSEGTEERFTFTAPGFAGPPAILMMMVHSLENAVELHVRLNGVEIVKQAFDEEAERSWHEVISGQALSAGENELVVSIPTGSSIFTGVDISDVVVLYQANVGPLVASESG